MNAFVIVGMGPGIGNYILPAGEAAIYGADLLVGDARHLARYPDKLGLPFGDDMEFLLGLIERKRSDCRIAVLVSGDPCLYSFHAAITKRFGPGEYEIVPGISSFQLACARAKIAWDDAVLVSVHGRPLSSLDRVPDSGPAVIFTDGDNNAAVVASILMQRLGPGRRCVAGERLGYPDERLVDSRLMEVARGHFGGLCVLILP